MIEDGNEKPVLALVFDDGRSHSRHEIEGIVPGCRLHLPVSPHHRAGEALLL